MTTSLWPVYVASKGRLDAPTLRSCERDAIPAEIWVAPSEADAYMDAYSDPLLIVETEAQDTGIGPTRRAILDWAREQGQSWIWMLDDDITSTFIGGERAPLRDTLLRVQEELELWPTVSVAGPMLESFAHFGREDRRNPSVYSFFALDTTGPWTFWDHYLEDIDIVMQVLDTGRHALKVGCASFLASPGGMGAGDGGCSTGYANGLGSRAAALLEAKWGDRLTVGKKVFPNGTPSYRPRRSAFTLPEPRA